MNGQIGKNRRIWKDILSDMRNYIFILVRVIVIIVIICINGIIIDGIIDGNGMISIVCVVVVWCVCSDVRVVDIGGDIVLRTIDHIEI